MSIDEMVAALEALLETARSEDRDLNDTELERAAELETQIATAHKTVELRSRVEAYKTPVGGGLQVMTKAKGPDTLERAFSEYLRTGQANQDIVELRAQSEGTPSEGGYLVPDSFRDKIVEARKAFGGLANEADNFTTTTGNAMEYPTNDDTANVGGITGEGAAFVDGADLVFGTVTLGAYKFTSTGAGTTTPLRVSVELLQDSAFDVESMIARKLGERIARKESAMWAVGSGSGEPQGIAGSSITENFDTDTHDVIAYADLLEMEATLDAAYEPNAKWLMHKTTWMKIRAMEDQADRPLILDNAQSGIGRGVEKMLLGYPVVIDQDMPSFPGAGNEHFIILGDLREAYAIRRVQNLVVAVNPYSRMNNGQVEFTAWTRADGVVQNRGAYVLMANTAS